MSGGDGEQGAHISISEQQAMKSATCKAYYLHSAAGQYVVKGGVLL